VFRKNNGHLQQDLFSSYEWLNPKIRQRLDKTWAPIFYEHVFCQIDETPFAVLYCKDNGRSNFPVNILLSLEFIKHMKNYTDEETIDQFYFNFQVQYALGLRDLGKLYLCPRTLYEFRERLYCYTVENPGKEDLIFGQFERLTAHFLKVAGINTREQRIDTTQIMPNIKRAGRLSLAYDVLLKAVKAIPKEMLGEELAAVLEPDFRTGLLYRCRGSELLSRLEAVLNLGGRLVEVARAHPELGALEEVQLLKRFLAEQGVFDPDKKRWLAQDGKDISPASLQSAHDHEATYRKKGKQEHVGYVASIAETCGEENPVQFITDYALDKNSAGDPQMVKERLAKLESTGAADLYVDGGGYSPEVEREAETRRIKMHYTDLTGRKPDPQKIPLSEFTIEDRRQILLCPAGETPLKSRFKQKTGILTAYFDPNTCRECQKREACPVKLKASSAVLRVSQKAVLAAETRNRLVSSDRRQAVSKRAAIEGTNSALKRAHGAKKLRVRGKTKCRLVIGMKIIGHNFRQLARFFLGDTRNKMAISTRTPIQGVPVSI